MISVLEALFVSGDPPDLIISPADLALEAGVSEGTAKGMIAASWAMVEAFTNKTWRPTTAGKIVIRSDEPLEYIWPRYPFPDKITAQAYTNGSWVTLPVSYVADVGLVGVQSHTLTKIEQVGAAAGSPATRAVKMAVQHLALYQIIQGPDRREFRMQKSGDYEFAREALMPMFRGSGAGALLTSEVRF